MNQEENRLPLCFVLMPFGNKHDAGGHPVRFDEVYSQIIKPAVHAAGMVPIRADEEKRGGFIHRSMFERLLLCNYAVADLTLANPNVCYELGVRHATRPSSTVMIFAAGFGLPFDLGPLRGHPYTLGDDGHPDQASSDQLALTDALVLARGQVTDSPIFQMLDGLPVPDLRSLNTDIFESRTRFAENLRARIARAAQEGSEAVRVACDELGDLAVTDPSVIIDALLTLHAAVSHKAMIDLIEALPEHLAKLSVVRREYAFALNRVGRGEEAERVLLRLLSKEGRKSEVYAQLAQVYRDRWERSHATAHPLLAQGLLDKAINAYLSGFDLDWRDMYLGCNAVWLMNLRHPQDPRLIELLPVVKYSLKRRLESGDADYPAVQTQLELAVIADDRQQSPAIIAQLLGTLHEPWEVTVTIHRLGQLRKVCERHGRDMSWLTKVERALGQALEDRGKRNPSEIEDRYRRLLSEYGDPGR